MHVSIGGVHIRVGRKGLGEFFRPGFQVGQILDEDQRHVGGDDRGVPTRHQVDRLLLLDLPEGVGELF